MQSFESTIQRKTKSFEIIRFVYMHWVPVKCETKQKRNGTKRNRSKRNKSKRNETKRNETNRNETKQMIWQAIVDKNRYFLILEIHL